MRTTKRKWANFSFYDHTGIEQTLERMAEKGWMLKKPGGLFWIFEKAEPQKLHFCVTYFPEASDYDAKPSEKQLCYEDFCAESGWKLVTRWGQMQIFCSELENPTPIDTDPLLQLEVIRKASKKTMLPTSLMMLGLFLYVLWFTLWQLKSDPIRFLSTPAYISSALIYFLLFLPLFVNQLSFLRWLPRAEKAAEHGELLRTCGHPVLQYVSLVLSDVVLLISFLQSGLTTSLISVLFTFLLVGGGAFLVNRLRLWLRKKGVSRRVNLALCIAANVAIALVGVNLIVICVFAFGFSGDHAPVKTVERRPGWFVDVYADEIPLRLEDFTAVPAEAEWSTEARKSASLLLAHTEYRQWGLDDDFSLPDLDYQITEVRAPFLYHVCKTALLRPDDEFVDGELMLEDHYVPADPAPWGAADAYQVYFSDGLIEHYLLCYDDHFVELRLDELPTPEQMAIIGEKLR